jgi:dipeptidyl aminopeptidase/acylaminoacyl peptidase
MSRNKLFIALALILLLYSCSKKQASFPSFSDPLTTEEIKNARITPEILWKYGRVAEFQISPDGKLVAYLVYRYKIADQSKARQLFLVSSNGNDTKQIAQIKGFCSNIKWTPEGNISFLAGTSGTSQIWEINIDGSNLHQVSNINNDIEIFDYSADSKLLFYTARVKTDTSAQDIYPELKKTSAMIFTDLMYRHWNSWTDYKHSHIFVAGYSGGKISEAKDIMQGEPYDTPLSPYFEAKEISWSPNGKYIAYTCKKMNGRESAVSTNSDIYLYSLETGKTTNISFGMPGYDRFPVFSPDSRRIAWQSMATPGYESDKDRLIIMNLADSAKTDLTAKFDQDISNILWDNTGAYVYFISGTNATYQVYKAEVATAKISQLTKGWHDYTDLNLQNDVLIGSRMSIKYASELFRINENGEETQLSFVNKNIYDSIKTGEVKDFWVITTDGKKMLTWVIYPPDFDSTKKYPAVLFCNGGPQSTVSQFFSFRWNFQIMAANGYIVIAPNRRGCPTFGSEWKDQIALDYGGQNMKDYLSAVDQIKKEPYVDAEKIGAVGPSYGGYSIFYLAGNHQKRFKAFIAHCGIFNLESQYTETEEVFFPNHDLGGPFWKNPKPISYSSSPHLYVQNWDTPIMIITGGNDFRIPYTEGLQAFNAAQLRGIPSKLLFFPDESHWVLRPQNSILWQKEFFKWLDKWLK